jgi:hypothetical protein
MAVLMGVVSAIAAVAAVARPAPQARLAPRAALAPGAAPQDLALRVQATAPSAAATQARASLRTTLGAGGFVTADAQSGGLSFVGRTDGFLTRASGAAPGDVALGYVRAHLAAFGLSASDLATLVLARSYTSIDGVTHLIWEQTVDGVPVVDSDLRANVAADGRLINVGGGLRGGLTLKSATPAVGARAAYAGVLRSTGSAAAAPAVRKQAGRLRTTDFAGDGAAGLVAYTAGGQARLAWRALVPASKTEDYDALIDAQTGAVVRRSNLVKFANGRVHDNFPGAALGGAQHDVPFTQWLAPGASTLTGNNAHAFTDTTDHVGTTITADAAIDHFEEAVTPDDEVPPSNGTDWLYDIQSFPDDADGFHFCPPDPPGCTWDHTSPFSWQANAAEATTELFYFVNTYHDHLAAVPIGFDAASGNFQRDNHGAGGHGGDPVLAQADDGADTDPDTAGLPDGGHQDNANFDTRPDGIPGRMQMYLFEPILIDPGSATRPPRFLEFGDVNGSDDPQVVYHEYTHGLSNRLVTDAQGFGALDNAQAGAMGEAWSDWYALDFLNAQGLMPDTAAVGDVDEGGYVDNGTNLIRSEPTDCPPGNPAGGVCPGEPAAGPGGYTYGDFGKILALSNSISVPEVHADGEIWAQTLWQLRAELVKAHGLAEGSRRAEQIVTGGMRLGPAEPTYLDERNAILQADTLAGNGDQALIWKVFAARGMGYFASTTGDQDVAPREDFSLPPAGRLTGTVRGVVRADGDKPLAGVRVGLSGHDTPNVGPALQSVTGADGTYTIAGVPQGSYDAVTADAPAGYADVASGPVTVGGAPVTVDLATRRNYADVTAGAALPGFDTSGAVNRNPPDPRWSNFRDESALGCGPAKTFDGDQGTAVDTTAPTDTDDPDTPEDETVPRYVTIQLAAPVPAAEIWIDPTAHCGDLVGSSLGTYLVSVSTDGNAFVPVSFGTFGMSDLHRLNKVPMNRPSPMPANIRFVRLTAFRSLAGPDEEGDPLSDGGFLGISELQVYDTTPTAAPTPQPTVSPTPTPKPTPGQLKPSLAGTSSRLDVSRRGAVTVKVSCVRATPGILPTTCRVHLTIVGKLPHHRKASTLANRTVTIATGRRASISLTLSRAALNALKRHTLTARLTAAVARRTDKLGVRLHR